MARPILLADLKANHACNPSRALFTAKYGEGGEATLEKFMDSALEFDWLFASQNLLSERQEKMFKTLMLQSFRFLSRVTDPDKAKRKKAMALAFYKAYNSPVE